MKVVLFILVTYFFIQQLSKLNSEHFNDLLAPLILPMVLSFSLLIFNLGADLGKWVLILKSYQIPINKRKVISSYFAGMATGLVTPNRIGNFLGRIIYFRGKMPAQLTLGTLYANFAQFIATVFFGVFGLLLIANEVKPYLSEDLLIYSGLTSFLFVVIYFLIPRFNLNTFNQTYKKVNVLAVFQRSISKISFVLLGLSGVRFLIFCCQYLLLLMAFGIPPSFELLGALFVFYFLSSIIPSVFIGKLLVRETMGLLILGIYIDNPAIILVSSLILWIVNLGIPSLVGGFFILKTKLTAWS